MNDTRWLLAWALGSVALGGASLLVPLYLVELGGSPFALGILAATAAFGGAPGALVVGRVADRTGRRRVFVGGPLAVVAATLVALPAVRSIPLVVLANAVLWFAAAAAAPVLSLLVVAEVPEHRWSDRYALLNKYQGYGWAGGLVLGAVWTAAGARVLSAAGAQRTFFLACAAFAVVGAVLAVRWLPAEGTSPANPRRVARVLGRARRLNVRGATYPFSPGRLYWTTRSMHPRRLVERFSRRLAFYYGGVALFFAGFAAFFAPLPAYLTAAAGFGSGAVFVLYLGSSLASAVFFVTAGGLASRYDLTVVQTAGLAVRGVAFPTVTLVGAALAGVLAGLAATVGVFLVIGLTWAVIAVTAPTLVTRLSPAGLRGEAIGVYTALAAVAGGVGSVVGGTLAAASYTVAFGVAGGLVLASAAVVFLVGRRAGAAVTEPAAAPTD